MIIPDVNLLVYAYNADAPFHLAAKRWWEGCVGGSQPVAIFAWVARMDTPAKGLFSAEAAAAYAAAIDREVRVDDIQPVVNELLAANVLMRLGHGLYGVSDPFVQEIWRERQTS